MSTIREIKTRLEAILDTATITLEDSSTVTLTQITPYEDTREIPTGDLPAYCVYQPNRATHERRSQGELQTEREWFVLVVVAPIVDDSAASKQEAYEACYPYLDDLAAWFANHLSLEDFTAADNENPDGLPGVIGMDIRESGVGETKRGAKRYSAIDYRLTITDVKQI